MTRNQDVAEVLREIAEILEVQNVAFKPRAYQRAAMNVEALGEDVEHVAQEGRLGEIPGVGKAIEEKITEFLKKGKLAYLEDLRKEVPRGLLEILRLPNVGPKTAARLYHELGIKSTEQLKKVAASGELIKLKGFGEKTAQEILSSIERSRTVPTRFPYPTALETARDLIRTLEKAGVKGRIEFAGSLRRGRDMVGDVDLLAEASAREAAKVTRAFLGHPSVKEVIESGETRSSVRLTNGIQADLRVLPAESYGAALCYFTGSKDHNIALRSLALKKGLTLSEYALARKKGGKPVAGRTEEEVYEALGLKWIPPELREDRGEIEAAGDGNVPTLVELKDLKGDLHTHTNESDGNQPAQAMVEEAARLGYEWYGISDHSKGLGIARGLDGSRFAKQRKFLAALEKKAPKMRILQGSEVNILKDGTMDLPAKDLAALDYVVGSVHSSFKLDEAEQTQRVLKALDQIDILGHPFGRLLAERDPIRLSWEKIVDMAVERGVFLEINSSPFRLDLWGEVIRVARERGARFTIDSDAHTVTGLRVQQNGIVQARRGGVGPAEVGNTLPVAQLEKRIGHARRR